MKRFIFLVFCALCFVATNAQINETIIRGSASLKSSYGYWNFQIYAPNIVKVTFTPFNAKNNDNISDAVILHNQPIMGRQLLDSKNKTSKINWPNSSIEVNDSIALVDGLKRIKIIPTITADFKTFKIELADNEKIFGGGERALPFNRRGYKFNLYNNPWYGYAEGADNLNYSVPFFTSSKMYGLYFDNPSKGFADIAKTQTNVFEVGFADGELNVYVITGKNYQEILQSYHKITGTQPLPPRWALGNLMSRFGYTSQHQVTEIAAKMKQEKIPFDAVIFDLFWFGDSIKGTLGNLDWVNKKAWPNPKQMIQNFKQEGINTILITEPFVLKTTKNFKQAEQYLAVDSVKQPYMLKDFYFGEGGLIDIFRKDAQQWFWTKHKSQMDLGVEGWWGDLGEPEKHPSNLYHQISSFDEKSKLKSANAVHNLYGHTWTKMLYNNFEKDYPNKRLFSLNRSGFAGTQRYNIFPWTGDVSRTWSGLKAQLPNLLGMAMSGVPYVHSDAGGFAGGEGDGELYTRWLQFAVFTPIFRPHGTALYDVDKNAFSYPSEAALMHEPYKSIAKEAIDLRYRLLPYNYNLAYEQTKNGSPLMAPLYYYFPTDTVALKVEDEYMWGKNILVAPVLEKGIKARKIYLPQGAWFSNAGKYFFSRGEWYDVDVNPSSIPFFFKAGSFTPMLATKVLNTSKADAKNIAMQYVVNSTPTEYELFNDDGNNKKSLEEGKYSIVKFSSTGLRSNTLSINIAPVKLQATDSSLLYKMILLLNDKPSNVMLNNKKVEVKDAGMSELKGCLWMSDTKTLYIEVPFDGKNSNLFIQFLQQVNTPKR